jgi:hypothetical protein
MAESDGVLWIVATTLVMGFFVLNTIGLCVILAVLYRGQFKSREKLLEIGYRLADLAETIEDTRKHHD